MSDDLTPEEIADIVQASLGELLNLASGVADLQTTDEAAEEIYAMCDLLAEYFQIERAIAVTEELPDGEGYITRFETVTGTPDTPANNKTIPGHIRTANKPKLRVIDGGDKPKPKKK